MPYRCCAAAAASQHVGGMSWTGTLSNKCFVVHLGSFSPRNKAFFFIWEDLNFSLYSRDAVSVITFEDGLIFEARKCIMFYRNKNQEHQIMKLTTINEGIKMCVSHCYNTTCLKSSLCHSSTLLRHCLSSCRVLAKLSTIWIQFSVRTKLS